MRYAESILLGGHLIHARDTFGIDWRKLLLVCPYSKKKVELGYPRNTRHIPEAEMENFLIWKHCEKISQAELKKCREKNKPIESQVDRMNNLARLNRIDIFKPNLLELIKSSAILNQSVTLEGLSDVFNDGLTKWFIEVLQNLTYNESFQDRIKSECQDLYNSCVRGTLVKESDYFSKLLSGI